MNYTYTCPACQTEHDHSDSGDAACASCGLCPDCSPSVYSSLVGHDQDCDECNASLLDDHVAAILRDLREQSEANGATFDLDAWHGEAAAAGDLATCRAIEWARERAVDGEGPAC